MPSVRSLAFSIFCLKEFIFSSSFAHKLIVSHLRRHVQSHVSANFVNVSWNSGKISLWQNLQGILAKLGFLRLLKNRNNIEFHKLEICKRMSIWWISSSDFQWGFDRNYRRWYSRERASDSFSEMRWSERAAGLVIRRIEAKRMRIPWVANNMPGLATRSSGGFF